MLGESSSLYVYLVYYAKDIPSFYALVFNLNFQEFKNDSDGSVQTISGRGGASLIASKNEDKLFVVGGFAGQEMDDVYTYDLKSNVWKLQSQMKLPFPRSVCISSGITVSQMQLISSAPF